MYPSTPQRIPSPRLGSPAQTDVNRDYFELQASWFTKVSERAPPVSLMKGPFGWDRAIGPSAAPGTERLTSSSRTRCRQPVCSPGQCLSEQERKEPLIILVTTGGRHTRGFLWEPSAPGDRHWACPRRPHATAQVGPLTVSACWLEGERPTLQTHVNNLRPFPEYEKQTNKGRMCVCVCVCVCWLLTVRFVYLHLHTVFFQKCEGWTPLGH